MKFSIITPSFNQSQFILENLKSISNQYNKESNQGISEIEHIIVDPGSTDGSIEIIKNEIDIINLQKKISKDPKFRGDGIKFINEKDRGQSHGISKGFNKSTGDILTWLNSDDYYPSNNVLFHVEKIFEENPEVDVVYGNVNFVDEKGVFLKKGYINSESGSLLESFQYQVGIVQPGVFIRRKVFKKIGGPSEEFEFCMDYEYWIRIALNNFQWKFTDKVLAHHRWWDGMKTAKKKRVSRRNYENIFN